MNGFNEDMEGLVATVLLTTSLMLLLSVIYILMKEEKEADKMEPEFFFDFNNTQLNCLLNRRSETMDDIVSKNAVSSRPRITSLNALLHDIHVRYIAIKKEDLEIHYRVFNKFFAELHKNMKEVDKYYQRYSSDVKFAGSHYDSLRIKKPNEFDMDIVIRLPVNMDLDPIDPKESDIIIEENHPGYVQLSAGVQYQKILVRDGVDCLVNRTAHSWLDDENYIASSKFFSWFKSVGYRALNKFEKVRSIPVCSVDGTKYKIQTSESGPAWTIILQASGFRLDIDLVPALKFPESRWPVGEMYRNIPSECKRGYWMVVPKPNKHGNTVQDQHRSWRIALQDQEKQLFKNTFALRQTIRLIKKFRDAQGMDEIASYYIKTIFFWEITKLKSKDPEFWIKNDITSLFKHMLWKFIEELDEDKIPYFWNSDHNLIEHVRRFVNNKNICRILNLWVTLEQAEDYNKVAKNLLSFEEYSEYCKFL